MTIGDVRSQAQIQRQETVNIKERQWKQMPFLYEADRLWQKSGTVTVPSLYALVAP